MAVKKSAIYSALWKSCDELRGSMDASQYKDYVLVMLFWKYISDKQKSDPYAIKVPKGCSFDDIAKLKNQVGIGDQLNKKLEEIAKVYHLGIGFFSNADFNNEDKLGKGKDLVDTVSNLIGIFQKPELDFSSNRAADDDLIGDAYEYLMRNFATQSGKSKGQFYTPAEASRLAAKLLNIEADTRRLITIYDMAAGSGSLLLRAADESRAGMTALYGQEKDLSTLNMAKMNMIIHGMDNYDLRLGDTLNAPHHLEDNNTRDGFDYCVANPPFSLKGWQKSAQDDDLFGRWSKNDEKIGLPPNGNGDYAFLLHLIRSTAPNGKAACFLPHGVLFRGGEEAKIRQNIINSHYISGIIGLPPNIFYGTGISACIIIIDKSMTKESKGIYMVDAKDGFRKDGAKNRLREEDIRRIIDVWRAKEDVPHFSRMVSYEDIADQEYNLNITRYITPRESDVPHDLYAHLHGGIPEADLAVLERLWEVCPTLYGRLLQPAAVEGYVEPTPLASEDIERAITTDSSYKAQEARYATAFDEWKDVLKKLMTEIKQGCMPKDIISQLSDIILKTFQARPTLVDPYEVYEALMEYWAETMQDDLYLISRDGWTVSAEVPLGKNNTPRKTYTYDQLECDLLPTPVVARVFFPQLLEKIEEIERQIGEKEEAISQLIAEDEELFARALNDKDQVVEKNVRALYKEGSKKGMEKEQTPEELKAWKRYVALADKKKKYNDALKAMIKELTREIEALYPELSEPQVRDTVLNHKWVAEIRNRLDSLMDSSLQGAIAKLHELADRYRNTLPELERAVEESQQTVLNDLRKLGFDI